MLYHIALAADWDAARLVGVYRTSTHGATLDEVGFVHAAFRDQVREVAERFYRNVTEPLVLLHVDDSRLNVPWRAEPAAEISRTAERTPDPAADLFPHVYGPITVDAVVAAVPLHRAADGSWTGIPGPGPTCGKVLT